MFESLNEAIGLPFSRKLHFTSKKKWLVVARNLQIYEFYTFLTLKLSQYCKSDSTFSSSEPVVATVTAADIETPCVCASQSDQPKLCQSA